MIYLQFPLIRSIFFMIFSISSLFFLLGCTKKSDLAQITEMVLDEDQAVKIEITPGKEQ